MPGGDFPSFRWMPGWTGATSSSVPWDRSNPTGWRKCSCRTALGAPNGPRGSARESAGNPFFAQVLALYSMRGGTPAALPGGQSAADLTMENAIWLWIQGLPEEAIRVLETIAVCSRPLSHTDALSAANASRDPSLLARLRAAKTVSSTGPGPDDNVQVYHDRIRETILARLPDSDPPRMPQLAGPNLRSPRRSRRRAGGCALRGRRRHRRRRPLVRHGCRPGQRRIGIRSRLRPVSRRLEVRAARRRRAAAARARPGRCPREFRPRSRCSAPLHGHPWPCAEAGARRPPGARGAPALRQRPRRRRDRGVPNRVGGSGYPFPLVEDVVDRRYPMERFAAAHPWFEVPRISCPGCFRRRGRTRGCALVRQPGAEHGRYRGGSVLHSVWLAGSAPSRRFRPDRPRPFLGGLARKLPRAETEAARPAAARTVPRDCRAKRRLARHDVVSTRGGRFVDAAGKLAQVRGDVADRRKHAARARPRCRSGNHQCANIPAARSLRHGQSGGSGARGLRRCTSARSSAATCSPPRAWVRG